MEREHQAFFDAASRFATQAYGFDTRQKLLAQQDSGAALWQQLHELGMLSMNIAEADGGLGQSVEASAEVVEALAPALLLAPYVEQAVATVALLNHLDSSEAHHWLEQLAEKTTPLLWLSDAEQELSLQGNSLSGSVWAAAHAPWAQHHLVVVPEHSATGDFAVLLCSQAQLAPYRRMDGISCADVHFQNSPVSRLGSLSAAALADAKHRHLAALCAEALGLLRVVVEATRQYTLTRHQFGQAIARFQVLQHRMADMLMHLEAAQSMNQLAQSQWQHNDEHQRALKLSAAKVVMGKACRFIGESAVQLHGGMGMTDELVLSHWFKRLTVIELSLGNTDNHLERFIELNASAQ